MPARRRAPAWCSMWDGHGAGSVQIAVRVAGVWELTESPTSYVSLSESRTR